MNITFISMSIFSAIINIFPMILFSPLWAWQTQTAISYQPWTLLDISFACPLAAAFPILFDNILELFASFQENGKKNGKRPFVVETCILIFSLIVPSIGYFFCRNMILMDVTLLNKLNLCLSAAQTSLVAGPLFSIINNFAPEIWTQPKIFVGLLFFFINQGLSQCNLNIILIAALNYWALGISVLLFGWMYVVNLRRVLFPKVTPEISQDCSGYFTKFSLGYATLIWIFLGVAVLIPNCIEALTSPEPRFIFLNFVNLVYLTILAILPLRLQRISENITESKLDAKQSFVRYIGHELRTPLNTSFVGVDVLESKLQSGNKLDADTKSIVTDIKEGMDSALRILTEIMDYDKITSRELVLERTSVSPLEYVKSCFGSFALQAAVRSIHWELIADDIGNSINTSTNTQLSVDVYKMGVVLSNFASNALKFTPSGGSVTVRLKVASRAAAPVETSFVGQLRKYFPLFSRLRDPLYMALSDDPNRLRAASDWLILEMTDSGAGMAPEDIPKLFTTSAQFDAKQLKDGKSSGLGLVISKGIVDLHGGNISARSPGLGLGSTFTLELPLEPPLTRDGPPLLGRDAGGEQHPRGVHVATAGEHASDTSWPMLNAFEVSKEEESQHLGTHCWQ